MKTRRKLLSTALFVLALTLGWQPLAAGEWTFFDDDGRAFAPLRADQREAQFRMNFMKNTLAGDKLWDLVFGGDLGLLQYKKAADDWSSLTVRGLISTRFEFFSESFNQLNADYVGGLAWGQRKGKYTQELFYYHQSSHLGDEVMQLGRARIDYSRETLRWMLARDCKDWRTYGGSAGITRAEPNVLQGKLWLQAGLEYKPETCPFFAAVDLQSHQEHGRWVNHTVVLGVEMGSPIKTIRRQRFQLEYYHGYSHMGQYYNEKEENVSFGIGFNF